MLSASSRWRCVSTATARPPFLDAGVGSVHSEVNHLTKAPYRTRRDRAPACITIPHSRSRFHSDGGGRARAGAEQRRWQTGPVRIPAKVDYAIRALAELASAGEGPIKADQLAVAQDIPINFLRDIMRELRRDRIVRSQRGPDGGFVLARPAAEISLADIFRAVDGPLAEVRDQSLSAMSYRGP